MTDDAIGTVDGFLEDLTELSQKHGIFIIGESEAIGYRKFSLVRLNAPHERPSEYPDVEKILDGATFSTVSEIYGYLEIRDQDNE